MKYLCGLFSCSSHVYEIFVAYFKNDDYDWNSVLTSSRQVKVPAADTAIKNIVSLATVQCLPYITRIIAYYVINVPYSSILCYKRSLWYNIM